MIPEEDWAMATGDLHTKFVEDLFSGSRDMLAHRQTDRRVDYNTLHPYRGGVNRVCSNLSVSLCVCVCLSVSPAVSVNTAYF